MHVFSKILPSLTNFIVNTVLQVTNGHKPLSCVRTVKLNYTISIIAVTKTDFVFHDFLLQPGQVVNSQLVFSSINSNENIQAF